jgi:hypothetical protein
MALFPLGILSAAGAGEADLGSYDLLETYILGSSQASVVFSSLGTYSSTYKHLQVRYTVRSTRTGIDSSALAIRLNGDTGSNYASHVLRGNGSNVASGAATSTASPEIGNSIPAALATANSFAAGVVDVLDPYSASKNTTVRNLGGATTPAYVHLSSVLWNNTAPITSIQFYDVTAANLLTGSRFSLYGIRG